MYTVGDCSSAPSGTYQTFRTSLTNYPTGRYNTYTNAPEGKIVGPSSNTRGCALYITALAPNNQIQFTCTGTGTGGILATAGAVSVSCRDATHYILRDQPETIIRVDWIAQLLSISSMANFES